MSEKATFRAMRESLGLSQSNLAKQIGVHVKTIKNWEDPSVIALPPQKAWDEIHALSQKQGFLIRQSLKILKEHPSKKISLTYYRDQKEFDEFSREKGLFSIANANSRAVYQAITQEGFSAYFAFPTDDDNIYFRSEDK